MIAAMRATQDDIDRIMAVMDVAFPPEFGEAWSRRQLVDALVIDNCHFALVDDAGAPPPTGTPGAGFRLSRYGFEEEELLLLAVAPACRRRGVGQTLLRALADDARQRGAKRLLLEMRRGNPAEALYRRFGFSPIGERRDYYRLLDGARVDAITFACDLQYC
jgi:ribosomal-protein-alanine N-acetyltransferase